MATISVIMGIYICAATLHEAVNSILNQTVSDWELIMCDDGSSDNTYELALEYASKFHEKIIVLKNQENLGLNATLNRCLEAARGEFIARMDADDTCSPNRFEAELNILRAEPSISIVSTDMTCFDESGTWGIASHPEYPQPKDFLYLRRCVDSILAQTYTDFELILVDDGSPDKCPAICDDYAQQDSRVKVIHKENGGLSDARNAGLHIASGTYISFVDSDDFIRKDMYEVMLAELIRTDADFIKSDFCTFSDITQIDFEPAEYHVQVYYPLEALSDFFETPYSNQKHMKSTVCDALYKKALFLTDGAVSLEFPVGKINEDTYIFPELLFRSNKIAHINEAFYFYYIREGGITHTTVNLREINSCDLWEHVYRVVRQHSDDYTWIIACNSISRYLNVLRRIYNSKYRSPYFDQIRSRLLLDQERLIPHVDDMRVKRTLQLIRVYPIYLITKRFMGYWVY